MSPTEEAGHAVAQRHDLAGDLEPEDRACAGRRRVGALPLRHVRPVHAGGGHLHQNVARLGLRHGAFDDLHRLWSAGGRKIDMAHGLGQGGHGGLLRVFRSTDIGIRHAAVQHRDRFQCIPGGSAKAVRAVAGQESGSAVRPAKFL